MDRIEDSIDVADASTDWSRPIGYFIRIDAYRDDSILEFWLTTTDARRFAAELLTEAAHAEEMNRRAGPRA